MVQRDGRHPTRRAVEVGGVSVPFLELGDPEGPPVVLLPGLSDGLAPITHPSAQTLFARVPLPMDHVRGIVISHRLPVGGQVTTRRLATGLATVLAALLDGPAVVVGHSMGAMVAQHLAADHPDLVRGLVLSAGSAHADDAVRGVLGRWDELLRARRFEAFALDAVETSFTGRSRERHRRLVRALPSPEPPDDLVARHLALSAACGVHDARARLHAVRHPVLVLAGADDVVIPVDHSRRLAVDLPDARLQVFHGLGHGFPEQAPERYADQVVPFVAAVLG